jgi:hypothetical protein
VEALVVDSVAVVSLAAVVELVLSSLPQAATIRGTATIAVRARNLRATDNLLGVLLDFGRAFNLRYGRGGRGD